MSILDPERSECYRLAGRDIEAERETCMRLFGARAHHLRPDTYWRDAGASAARKACTPLRCAATPEDIRGHGLDALRHHGQGNGESPEQAQIFLDEFARIWARIEAWRATPKYQAQADADYERRTGRQRR